MVGPGSASGANLVALQTRVAYAEKAEPADAIAVFASATRRATISAAGAMSCTSAADWPVNGRKSCPRLARSSATREGPSLLGSIDSGSLSS
jgi:hypothetical protein